MNFNKVLQGITLLGSKANETFRTDGFNPVVRELFRYKFEFEKVNLVISFTKGLESTTITIDHGSTQLASIKINYSMYYVIRILSFQPVPVSKVNWCRSDLETFFGIVMDLLNHRENEELIEFVYVVEEKNGIFLLNGTHEMDQTELEKTTNALSLLSDMKYANGIISFTATYEFNLRDFLILRDVITI